MRRLAVSPAGTVSARRRRITERRSVAAWVFLWCQAPEGPGRRERKAEEAALRSDAGSLGTSRASAREMAGPAAKHEAVAQLQAAMGLSERRTCSFVGTDPDRGETERALVASLPARPVCLRTAHLSAKHR